MLNPQRLVVLRELAERGSFTATAEALSYTQSAVSQQISRSSARPARSSSSATASARAPPRRARSCWVTLTRSSGASAPQSMSWRHIWSALGTYATRRVRKCGRRDGSAAVAAFHDRHPGVELSVVQMEPAEATAALENRQLDLAIVYDFTPATGILGGELELTHLFDDRYVAVIPKRHRLAKRGEIELADLGADVWIHPTPRDLAARSFSARAAQRASSRALPSRSTRSRRARRSSRPEPASPFCPR